MENIKYAASHALEQIEFAEKARNTGVHRKSAGVFICVSADILPELKQILQSVADKGYYHE